MEATSSYPFEGGHDEVLLVGILPAHVDETVDVTSLPEDVISAGVQAHAFLEHTVLPATHEFLHPMEEAGVMPR